MRYFALFSSIPLPASARMTGLPPTPDFGMFLQESDEMTLLLLKARALS
jgi:hypothetical protein